jgi:hypothetical protein
MNPVASDILIRDRAVVRRRDFSDEGRCSRRCEYGSGKSPAGAEWYTQQPAAPWCVLNWGCSNGGALWVSRRLTS